MDGKNQVERKLAVVMFADVVGYTAMMQQDEELGRSALIKFREATKEKVATWNGKIVQFYGDGCLILYDSAANALQCARELQHAFQTSHQIPVRMGLHMGDVFIAEDHVYGDTVNIASRIESMGIPGSILFSDGIHDNIKNQKDFVSSSLGSYRFKNIMDPIQVHALIGEGLTLPDREQTAEEDLAASAILIIEDEPLAADRICAMVKKINPNNKILEVLDSVEGSIEWLQQNRTPDVILSDIQLADGLSLKIYETVTVSCPVIFTTAYEKYAIQAFEVNGVDYLLKPIKQERLEQALAKCINRTPEVQNDTGKLLQEFKLLLTSNQNEYKSRFLCKLGNKIKSVAIEQVSYFYSKNKITFLVSKDGSRFPVNHTLDEVDNLVDPKHFFRANRQFVIHFDSISEIQPYFKGRLKVNLHPEAEEELTISSEKSPVFKAWLDR